MTQKTTRTPRVVMFIASRGGAESRVLTNIYEQLSDAGVKIEARRTNQGKDVRFDHLTLIRDSDVIILQSPLFVSWPYALLAKALGKKIISIVWDCYPVTLGGVRFDRRIRRRVFDRIEGAILEMSSQILVPSRDFLEQPALRCAKAVKLWYPIHTYANSLGSQRTEGPLRVLFAGQINQTRGLVAATERLDNVTRGEFELLIASGDPLPDEIRGRENVLYLGRLDRKNLREVAARCDCGLVPLARDFDGPGLPSKTFEYLEAGIPCIYYGKKLKHYTDILQRSGAGFDIANMETLHKEEVLKKKDSISEAAIRFSESFSLNVGEILEYITDTETSRCGA